MSLSSHKLDLIKELRSKTGISIKLCREALEKADYNMQRALDILSSTQSKIVFKDLQEDHPTRVWCKRKDNYLAMITLGTKTDFALKSGEVEDLISKLADICFENFSRVSQDHRMILELGHDSVKKTQMALGESIKILDLALVDASPECSGYYIHNLKHGCIIVLKHGSAEEARQLAIQAIAFEALFAYDIDHDKLNLPQSEITEELEEKYVLAQQPVFYADSTLSVPEFLSSRKIQIQQMVVNSWNNLT